MGRPIKDYTGKVFGGWTVLSLATLGNGQAKWLCRCVCGTERVVFRQSLVNGMSKSCGCLGALVKSQKLTKHGHGRAHKRTKTYISWYSMKARCLNPNCHKYPEYGARGITVCERWMEFEAFLEDMGECPPGHSIDRIDNGGNYEPGNCRWATPKQQQRNMRSNRIISHDGRSLCLSEWAEVYGMPVSVLRHRLDANWSAERAITTPYKPRSDNKCNRATA